MTFLFSFSKLSIVLAVCMAAVPAMALRTPAPRFSQSVSASQDDSMIEDILRYVNQYRQGKGLPGLQINPVMSVEAKQHSINMASGKTAFGHDGFESRVKAIIGQLGPMHRSAENVALGKMSAKEVVNGWLNSPPHRKNIEGAYALTGIGTATNSEGTIYFTQIFTAK